MFVCMYVYEYSFYVCTCCCVRAVSRTACVPCRARRRSRWGVLLSLCIHFHWLCAPCGLTPCLGGFCGWVLVSFSVCRLMWSQTGSTWTALRARRTSPCPCRRWRNSRSKTLPVRRLWVRSCCAYVCGVCMLVVSYLCVCVCAVCRCLYVTIFHWRSTSMYVCVCVCICLCVCVYVYCLFVCMLAIWVAGICTHLHAFWCRYLVFYVTNKVWLRLARPIFVVCVYICMYM